MSRHIASGNAVGARVRGAAGSENQLLDLARIIEGQKLRDDAAHGVAADDSLLDIQVIEQRRSVVGEHLDRIFLDRFTRLAGAAIVEDDDFVIAGEFGDLMKFPRLVVEAGDAAEQKRRAIAVNFIVDLGIFEFKIGHGLIKGAACCAPTSFIWNLRRR